MRWLRIIIIAVLLGCVIPISFIPSLFVRAATTADILVTATPDFGGGVPTNFTLTLITNYEVLITWDKGASANNTMIRAKMGSYPTGVADGYQVYYGTGTSYSDTAVDFNEYWGEMHYRAWSDDTDGNFSSYYAEGKIGGDGVVALTEAVGGLAIAFGLFVTILGLAFFSVMAFWKENALLFMLSGGAAIMTGFLWYDAITTNVGLAMGLLLIGYSLVCIGFAFKCMFWRGNND